MHHDTSTNDGSIRLPQDALWGLGDIDWLRPRLKPRTTKRRVLRKPRKNDPLSRRKRRVKEIQS